MNSNEYWKKRAEERENEWSKKSKKEIEREIKNLYIRALINIKKDINDLYERFADENGLSMADAKKLITGNEYTIWRMDIEDYVQKSKLDNNLLKELNTLAMKSRISRLDKLYGEISIELVKMAEEYDNQLSEYLRTSLVDNYYHTTFDICKGLNLLLPVSSLDSETIEDIIKTPWSGKQFSERIWNNTDILSKVLKQEISSAMIRGVNAREMAQVISKKMGSSYKQAVTLVRSELNYVNNQSSLKSIKDAEGQKYRFIATLDSRTSMICRQLDGTIHEVNKGVPGTNMPPMHPRCRSTIAISNLTISASRKRISRVNGEIKYVPANMKYNDWEKIYVKKTITFDEWQKENKSSKINLEHKVVSGKNIVGQWKRRPDLFKNEIDDVVNYQGFDGLPRLVDNKEEFWKLVDDDHFIGKRVYTAKTQEQLDKYAHDLRYGKWYIDCHVGGAQFGQGMYCSLDYTKGSRIKEIESIMNYYINEYNRHGKSFYKVETFTFDKSAKILYVPREKVFSNIGVYKAVAKAYVNNNPKEFGLSIDFIKNISNLNIEQQNKYEKICFTKAEEIFKKKIDPSIIAIELGYDAIKAERRNGELPHTIILNRTKVILFEGG